MPSKSNKFDFTNRTSLGLKMGHIVGNVLEKEAEKLLKEAEKQLIKARKPSCANSVEVGECYTHITHLDIKVPDKQLGDDGTCALLAGLEAALRNGTEAVRVALEDLSLTGNGITTTSLMRMAPIISLASQTIRTLNISSNKIEVEGEKQMREWECFLEAFACCSNFHRLDLTGNTKLGSKALEILAKVYVRADDISPFRRVDRERRNSSDSGKSLPQLPNAPRETGDPRSGLRSIPYIILNDTGMDDAGALWLSYVIEDHFYPSQLIPDQDGEARRRKNPQDGIEWQYNNEALSKDGQGVLTRSESIRQQLSEDGNDLDAADLEQETRLLSSGRKKLQRALIANRGGVDTIDLWRAAVKVLCMSRIFTYRIDCLTGGQGEAPVKRRSILHEWQVLGDSHARQKPSKFLFPSRSENIKPGRSDDPTHSKLQHLQDLNLEPAGRASISHDAFMEYQERYLRSNSCSKPRESSQVTCDRREYRLPRTVVKCIIAHVLSPRERDSLTEEQFENAFRWGQDRATLRKECEWLKDHRSIQILRLLEDLSCIEYCRV